MALTIGSGWTMGAGWTISDTAAVVTDPYFMYNSLLLPSNGTNNAQNNTFLDSSTNNFTLTRNGNTTQGSFSPYGANWSNYFSGTSTYFTAPSNTALAFGTGNFTIECWVFVTRSTNNYGRLFWFEINNTGTTGSGLAIEVYSNSGGQFNLNTGNGQTGANATDLGRGWHHVAAVRSSGVTKLYVDGVATSAGVTDTTNYTANTAPIIGGGYYSGAIGAELLEGYLSNFRVVKGTAVYTSNFIPSTVPLTAITNTSLLTCQSNRFIDNSTNNFTLTATGTPSVQRFNPFEPSAAYSTSTIGGSGYFDGTGDYLSLPNNAVYSFGTGDFTIECWAYVTQQTTNQYYGLFGKRPTTNNQGWLSLNVRNNVTVFAFASSQSGGWSSLTTGNLNVPLNAWSHFAVSRSGSNIRIFVNGVIDTGSSITTSAAVVDTTSPFFIGTGTSDAGGEFFQGYISNLRVVKGTAVYTTAFTPPTAPVTAVANTAVLTDFTNAGITDSAMMNDLETVGDAQISTTQSKFGGSSMSFDGTGDYLLGQTTQQTLTFGTGNFTVECWAYPVSYVSPVGGILDSGSGVNGNRFSLVLYANGKIYIDNNTNLLISTTTISTGTWTHIAICRSNGTMTMYFNGTSVGSVASSTNFSETYNRIGSTVDGYSFNGYIDDLRITKGYARYTSNFTPPTSAFPLY